MRIEREANAQRCGDDACADWLVFGLLTTVLSRAPGAATCSISGDEADGRSLEAVASEVSRAELDEIESHTEQLGYYLADAEQCWEIVWYTGARIPLTYLPPPLVERFKANYVAAVAASATERGIWVDWPAVFSLARKPGEQGSA